MARFSTETKGFFYAWMSVGLMFYSGFAFAQSRSEASSPRPGAPAARSRVNAPAPRMAAPNDYYLKARDFFNKGRYRESFQYASQSMKLGNNSRQPLVLMAQSYYRLGLSGKSAGLFLSLSPQEIPREAAFDYILAMYATGRHREAIRGLSMLPDQHPYRDVARYYVGLSYMNLRLYQNAQMVLRSARRLPANLNSSRRRILSEIDDILEAERQGIYDQSRRFEYQYQPLYIPPPVEVVDQKPGAPAPTPKVPPPAPPKSGGSFFAKPSLSYNQTSIKREYHGFIQEQYDETKPSAAAALGYKYLGSPRSFGAQPSLDLTATVSYLDIAAKTSTSSLQADAANPDDVRNVTTSSEVGGYNFSQAYAASAMFPVSDPVDLAAGYEQREEQTKGSIGNSQLSTGTANGKLTVEISLFKLDLSYISASITNKITPESSYVSNTMKGSLTRNGENSTLNLSGSLQENSKSLVTGGIKSVTSFDGSWVRNIEDFSIGLSANKTDKTRNVEDVGLSNRQILSLTSEKIEGTYNLSFGVSVVGSFTLYQLSNLVTRNNQRVTDGPDEVFNSGSANQYKLSLKVGLASYASVAANYDYMDRTLSAGDPTFEKLMMKDNWSQQTTGALNLSMNYAF